MKLPQKIYVRVGNPKEDGILLAGISPDLLGLDPGESDQIGIYELKSKHTAINKTEIVYK